MRNDGNLNFGQLLHLLEPSIKSSVRRYEKLIKSCVSLSCGVLFNETYIYIYISSSTHYIIIHFLLTSKPCQRCEKIKPKVLTQHKKVQHKCGV